MDRIEDQAAEILASLPSVIRDRAESLRNLGEKERWQCGEDAADLVDELAVGPNPRYSKGAVRQAVARMYHVTDSTVADREWVVRRVPASLRNAFPALTYHYWRACAQAGTTQGILNLAYQIDAHVEAWGSLPRVSQVYSWLKETGDALPVWRLRLRRAFAILELVARDPMLPPDLAQAVANILASIHVDGQGPYNPAQRT